MGNITKGGRKRQFTNLELRRRLWDAMRGSGKDATKCPGSNKK